MPLGKRPRLLASPDRRLRKSTRSTDPRDARRAHGGAASRDGERVARPQRAFHINPHRSLQP